MVFFFGLSESEWSCLSFIKILASSLWIRPFYSVHAWERKRIWVVTSFIYLLDPSLVSLNTTLLFSCVYVHVIFVPSPHSMWDHSFPTRVKPILPAVEAGTVNHWTTREVPSFSETPFRYVQNFLILVSMSQLLSYFSSLFYALHYWLSCQISQFINSISSYVETLVYVY